ncbi:MAG TPA: hypothetical protein VGE39_06785 [Prosthecobacter sp.]
MPPTDANEPAGRGGQPGNKNAAKPDADKLTENRNFRFTSDELSAYNHAKPRDMPLRTWVRMALNQAAGNRFTLALHVPKDAYMLNSNIAQLLGVLVRLDCYQNLDSKPEISGSTITLHMNSLREKVGIQNEVMKATATCGFEIISLTFEK